MHEEIFDTSVPATRETIEGMVHEHDTKAASLPKLVRDLADLKSAVNSSININGAFGGGGAWGRSGAPSLSLDALGKELRTSAWRAAYKRLHIDKIAPAHERSQFETQMENAPDFTMDNLIATFGHYVEDPRMHILRGLAKVFADLDPFFRSHSKVKVGVKGLPKRVIIRNLSGYGSHGREQLTDLINALRTFEGRPHMEYSDMEDWLTYSRRIETGVSPWAPNMRYASGSVCEHDGEMWKCDGAIYHADEFTAATDKKQRFVWRKISDPEPSLKLKLHKNCNAHLHFEKEKLIQINRALAEFYGDVLPDVAVEPDAPRPSTEVSAKLAFYRTPAAVMAHVLKWDAIYGAKTILEPNAGEGDMIAAMMEVASEDAEITGIEVDASRHAICRKKGFNVRRANFLEVAPDPRFDRVVMNPPFNGTHWKKHITHALKFLKPADPNERFGSRGAGRLIAVLPASAHYDGHLDDIGKYEVEDLPVASFAESGTRVPTIIIRKWAD